MRALRIALTALLLLVLSTAQANPPPSEDCPLVTSSGQTYQAWRTTSNTAANRVNRAISIFNLDCLRNIAFSINIPLPRFPSLGSLLQGLANRICQVVMNAITTHGDLEPATRIDDKLLYDRRRRTA